MGGIEREAEAMDRATKPVSIRCTRVLGARLIHSIRTSRVERGCSPLRTAGASSRI